MKNGWDEEVCTHFNFNPPPKVYEPGYFTLPCTIGLIKYEDILLDLGASVNLMSYRTYKNLGLKGIDDNHVSLQFADGAEKHAKGIVKDLLIEIMDLKFKVNFVVMELKKENVTPLILGRPFLATSHALIGVFHGEIFLRVDGDPSVFFKKDNPFRSPFTTYNITNNSRRIHDKNKDGKKWKKKPI